jgi:hypothetical protein
MFQTKIVEKIKTYISCSVFFFEIRTLYEIVWKFIVESAQAKDNSVVHAFCIIAT